MNNSLYTIWPINTDSAKQADKIFWDYLTSLRKMHYGINDSHQSACEYIKKISGYKYKTWVNILNPDKC